MKETSIFAEMIPFLQQIVGKHSALSHASNIQAKLSRGLNAKESRALQSLLPIYRKYISRQLRLNGFNEATIKRRVQLLNRYYSFYDNHEMGSVFSAQGKMRSTILEEFMYLLFKDYIDYIKSRYRDEANRIMGGATKAYTNLYFTATGIENFIHSPHVEINVKDQDFAIYREVQLVVDGQEKHVRVPIVAIENKTYVDKTMLEGIIATAEKIKSGNPYTWFVVVTETYEVGSSVDPIYSRIDQIYVLRKGKRRECVNEIEVDVVLKLFADVRRHVERPWSNIETKMHQEGIIM